MSAKLRLVYKGFYGEAERGQDGSYQGLIINSPDGIAIGGGNLAELQQSFSHAVDQCIGLGQKPGHASCWGEH